MIARAALARISLTLRYALANPWRLLATLLPALWANLKLAGLRRSGLKVLVVYIDHEGDWYLEFRTVCRHLTPSGTCGIYAERPLICEEYSWEECEVTTREPGYRQRFDARATVYSGTCRVTTGTCTWRRTDRRASPHAHSTGRKRHSARHRRRIQDKCGLGGQTDIRSICVRTLRLTVPQW